MRRILNISLLGLMGVLPLGHAHAAQTDFNVFADARTVTYRFGWIGHDGKPYKSFFRLARNDVETSAKDFQPFDNVAASKYVSEVINAYNAQRKRQGVKMDMAIVGDRVKFSATEMTQADFNAEVKNVKAMRKKAMDTFIASNLYTKVTDTSVMPDHKRIASMYVGRMRTVAESLARSSPSYDPRARINTVLSFLQALPYDTLDDRTTSNGAGFVTPIQLLTQNKGDCDSKAVAMASILRNLYPKLRIVMIYIPGHAFVGLKMDPEPNDVALKIGKHKFVLAEPVGPARVPLGQIAPDSYAKLKQYEFSYQEVPF